MILPNVDSFGYAPNIALDDSFFYHQADVTPLETTTKAAAELMPLVGRVGETATGTVSVLDT